MWGLADSRDPPAPPPHVCVWRDPAPSPAPCLHLVLPYLCSPPPNVASCWPWRLTCNAGIKNLKHESYRVRSHVRPYSPNQASKPPPSLGAPSPLRLPSLGSQPRSRFFCGMTTRITLLIHACSSLLSASCWKENFIRAGTSALYLYDLPCTHGTPRRAQLGNAARVFPPLNKPTMLSFSLLLLKPRNTPVPGEGGVIQAQIMYETEELWFFLKPLGDLKGVEEVFIISASLGLLSWLSD